MTALIMLLPLATTSSSEYGLAYLLATAVLGTGTGAALIGGLFMWRNNRADTDKKQAEREKLLDEVDSDRIIRLVETVKEIKTDLTDTKAELADVKTELRHLRARYANLKTTMLKVMAWAQRNQARFDPADPFPVYETAWDEDE